MPVSVPKPICDETLRFLNVHGSFNRSMGITNVKGANMKEARVSFKSQESKVRASLAIDGFLVVDAVTVPEVARILKVARCARVRLDDGFAFPLPANSTVLSSAAAVPLAQSLATFHLISECSWPE